MHTNIHIDHNTVVSVNHAGNTFWVDIHQSEWTLTIFCATLEHAQRIADALRSA